MERDNRSEIGGDGAGAGGEWFTRVGRQVFVEAALGARVVAAPGAAVGYQKQYLNKDGSIRCVSPGSNMEYKMFELLCTPDAGWPVQDD